MKKKYVTLNLKTALFILAMFTSYLSIGQPTREGSIDLTGGDRRYILMNHDGSARTLGIEGGAFTIEAWIYMVSNSSNNFNFFTLVSGDRVLSLSYKGDDYKNTDEAWWFETKGLPEKGGKGERWNFYRGYSSGVTPPTFLNQWHHVAFTVDNGSSIRLYIDGSKVISTNLTHNGSELADLWPADGDGNCYIGHESVNQDRDGKFYVGEIRVWDAQLSDAEISKYYDEEVNKSHPHWNDLKRYYHGTESRYSDTDRIFEDRSPAGTEYDATVSHSDVGVASDYSPTVKPPSFDDSDISISFTANDCQTSDIDISWTDFEYDSWGYENANDVYYKLTRDTDSKTIYTGTSNNQSDTDVEEGDKHRYKLQTYWTINGAEVYSDDAIYSDYGTIKMQYDAPTNLTATLDNCDKSIDLSWTAADGTPPNWTIQRANNSGFTSGVTTITTSLSGSKTSYTVTNQSVETSRYFRVYASGTDDNGCTVSGSYPTAVEGNTSYPASAPTNMTITQDLDAKTLTLNWTNPSGNNADSWVIKRTKFDGSDEVEYTTALGTTSYVDSDLQLCQTYSYTIGAVNECAADGNFATTSLTGNISTDLSDAIGSIEASKGYFSDAVQVEWELKGSLSNIDRFRVYRSRADKNSFSLLKVLDNDLIYTDETAVGGVFYNYKVVGEAACEDYTIYTNEGIDMGFVIPYGVANGHVEYDGGNAVEDVTVTFTKDDGATGNSLLFDGVDDYAAINGLNYKASNIKEVTVEAWIKTSSGEDQIIASFDRSEYWRLEIGGSAGGYGTIGWGLNTNAGTFDIKGTIRVDDGEWHHIAAVYDNGYSAIYVDGVLDVSDTKGSTFGSGTERYGFIGVGSEASSANGSTGPDYYFNGNIDEIRIWNVARSKDEIAKNYNRLINGATDGLSAYWRCDEGIGSYAYDASKTDDEFNKNDLLFVNEAQFSSEIPTADLLGIRGITNEYGDYTIDYIPYSSGGEIFKVTPSIGQHAFEPSSRTVYIGDGAKTQNGLDFTDISSFQVTGKVTYENSQVPVEGVSILIDGVQAVGSDNQPVRTDSEGNYEIQVPIGYHFLSAKKDGHTFSEGYFPPLNAYGDVETFEFTEDISVNFTDDTKIKVAGRIIGGTVEGDKKIGFGLSNNNIGVADLKLKLQKEGYDLDVADTTIYDVISVTTDPYTGEYEVEVIPEKWVVEQAGNDTYFIDPQDIPVLDLSYSLEEVMLTDTTEVVGTNGSVTSELDTFYYHHELNYVIRQTPSVYVYDDQDGEFGGETEIYFTSKETGEPDTLVVADAGFDFPFFTQGKVYGMNVYVQEKYENPAHPDGALVDYVPVQNADIVVVDNMGANPEGTTGKTDANGLFYYEFRAGFPSLSVDGENSYTQTLQVNATTDSESVAWPEDDLFRGYILGGLPQEGTDFVTYGPDVVEMILRDPPGSHSYAYIEKGSTFSKSETWTVDATTDQGLNQTWHKGMYIGAGGGLAGPIMETTYTLDSEIGLGIERGYDYDGNYTESWTFNERIETSSDPEDVGSDADIYIGKAYNAYVTKTKTLTFIDRSYCEEYGLTCMETGDDVLLGIIDGFAVDDGNTATYFAYSQRHIVEELLPELLILRDELFKTDKYESHFPWGHQFYGVSNDNNTEAFYQFKLDTLAVNPAADITQLSYTFHGADDETDSVSFINEQIRQWINALAKNESEKVSAATTKNISIDGSSGAISEEITETFSSEYNWESARKVKFDWNAEFGVVANGNGYTMKNTFNAGFNFGSGEDLEKSHNVTFGYVIDERDEGDYYSIDVKHTKGVQVLDRSKFIDFIPDKDTFIESNLTKLGIGVGFTGVKSIATKLAAKYTSKSNSFIATAAFIVDAAVFTYELADVTYSAMDTYDKQDELGENYDISGFRISSPIFSVRGGQSRCPYEGEEVTSFYVDNNEPIKLHTATLLRENPKIDAEPSIRSNVPENEEAVFTLKLQNESESNSDMWYEISIDEASNPDGAIILVDGLSAERSYLVPAWETVTKTLTIKKGASGVLDYDSIAVILHSTCQFDPTTSQDDVADTVYLSAHFLPACSDVELQGFADNWVVNYEDNNQVAVTLTGYDLNHSTLEKIDFQYKSLSGSPIAVKGYFTDSESPDFDAYGDQAELLDGRSKVSFMWDISDLTDRTYQVRARATCSDGSVTETDYLTGVIDRVTPVVFGTPEPSDGILEPSDDISVRFNEALESGLVKDHNISVKSILNGSDVSHATSVQFNGVNEYARIPSVSFNNKPFTIEYWLKRDAGTAGTVFSKGAGTDLLEIAFNADETILLTVGTQSYSVDPSAYYTAVTPVDAWHHWGLAYDNETDELRFIMDDQLLMVKSNVTFSQGEVEHAYLAAKADGSNALAGQMHEVRLWDKAFDVSQSVEYMNQTLSGDEAGLYGYWPMDEGDGSQALDKAAGRHMVIDATWNLYPGSDAFAFNGTSQYLTLDGNNVVISDETDFTVEFWFQTGTPAATQTIFSSGRGDKTDTLANVEYALSINALPSGQINVVSNGNTFTAVSGNYFDNQWHHFALVVDRESTTRTYIDGKLQKSSSAAGIEGLAGSALWLGARGYKTDPVNSVIDQYFEGVIDEFRIWNSARPLEYINNYKNTKLVGDEAGLIAYLPFEEYEEVMGTIVRNTTLSDEATPQFLEQADPAVAAVSETFVNGASIRDVRPLQDIPFDFVVNGDEIVITPIIDAYRIEGQTLEISVSDVTDLNGNRQLSTVSWTAYAQQNELVWQENTISIEQEEGVASTFTATIANLGGVSYDYVLEDMPAWLKSSQESGTVAANSTKTLTFTVDAGLNVGYYERSINLGTSLDFDEKLTIDVSVSRPSPNWEVDTDQYQYSMNLFGRLIINDVVSTDVNDIVAAYVGDEIRGVAMPEYVEELDEYLLFMTIYGNGEGTENISFKVWNASKGQTHEEVTPEIIFLANSIVGTTAAPQDIVATDAISTTIEFGPGWNWVSFNLESSDLEIVSNVFSGVGVQDDIVKGQDAHDIYDEVTGWMGGITLGEGLQVEEMYKVYLKNGGTVKYSGIPVDPQLTTIQIDSGWNYVGYTPQVSMTVSEALTGLNPATGDIIKSQNQFAMYNSSFGWVGSLKNMAASEGYMIYSANNAAFVYPETSSLSSSRLAGEYEETLSLPNGWNIAPSGRFSDNLSIIAEIAGETNVSESDILLAYVGDEIRGYAKGQELGNGKFAFFLTVHGNAGDQLTFSLYNEDAESVTRSSNQLQYVANAIIGDIRQPYPVALEEALLSENLTAYPNPFTDELNVILPCEGGTIELYDALGNLYTSVEASGRTAKLELARRLPRGTYLLRVIGECGVHTTKVVKID